jgi:hypothetical protein
MHLVFFGKSGVTASSALLPFLPSKMAPTASSLEAKLVAMSNSSLESTGGLHPSSRTWSPVGRTLEEGMHDLGLSYARELGTTLGEAPYEVPE